MWLVFIFPHKAKAVQGLLTLEVSHDKYATQRDNGLGFRVRA